MKDGIEETNKKLFFREAISKRPLEIELCMGWIRITQFAGLGGLFGQKQKFKTISITSEDALKLRDCITRLAK